MLHWPLILLALATLTTQAQQPTIFQSPLPLAPYAQFANTPTRELLHDKAFRKLLHDIVPNCTFHYGTDMSLADALDLALKDSRDPITLRDGRFLLASGRASLYPGLGGRAFLWLDLHDGLALGGFFFRPTNGEPTPTLAVFSRQIPRQIKERALGLSDLPPDFAPDLAQWTDYQRLPPLTTRYFISGNNKRILLEHDEDLCAAATLLPGPDCDRLEADAADLDLNAADYLEAIHYATNGTAWTADGNQLAWLATRDRTCGLVADPFACRIRLTRERIHLVTGRPISHPPHR